MRRSEGDVEFCRLEASVYTRRAGLDSGVLVVNYFFRSLSFIFRPALFLFFLLVLSCFGSRYSC